MEKSPAVRVNLPEGSKQSIDLTPHVKTTQVKIIPIVTELDLQGNPIYPKEQIVSANNVPLSKTPIFVEEV